MVLQLEPSRTWIFNRVDKMGLGFDRINLARFLPFLFDSKISCIGMGWDGIGWYCSRSRIASVYWIFYWDRIR